MVYMCGNLVGFYFGIIYIQRKIIITIILISKIFKSRKCKFWEFFRQKYSCRSLEVLVPSAVQ